MLADTQKVTRDRPRWQKLGPLDEATTVSDLASRIEVVRVPRGDRLIEQ